MAEIVYRKICGFLPQTATQKERAAAPKRRRKQEQSVVAVEMQNIENIMELPQFEEAWRAKLTIGNEGISIEIPSELIELTEDQFTACGPESPYPGSDTRRP